MVLLGPLYETSIGLQTEKGSKNKVWSKSYPLFIKGSLRGSRRSRPISHIVGDDHSSWLNPFIVRRENRRWVPTLGMHSLNFKTIRGV